MSRTLTDDEWAELLKEFEHSAFRLEQQPSYMVDVETGTVARFLAGDPQDPREIPHLDSWFDQIARLTAEGRKVGRVRIVEDPPTGYQRWEQWLGRWNAEAGETIRYLTRQCALEVGVLPAAGSDDWWLLDDERLIVMHFDKDGRLGQTELVADPDRVTSAQSVRDLAIRHSAKTPSQGTVAR